MEMSLTPWMLPGLIGTVIACRTAVVAWRRRRRVGAHGLLVLALGVAWWCLLQAVLVALPTLEGKIAASKLQYLGISTVPLAWFWFAATYTSRGDRIPPFGWALLALPEVVTLVLAWTNEWHGLVWRRLWLEPAGSFSALRIEYGTWFQLHAYYAHLLVVVGTLVLVASLVQARHHTRRVVAVVVAALCPVGANVFYLLGLTSSRWIDLTPSGFALGGLVLTWSLLREDLLDLPPITRSRVMDAIHEGVLVLDPQGRVMDLNPAASTLLGCDVGDVLAESLLPVEPSLRPAHGSDPVSGPRDVVQVGDRALEVSCSTTRDVPGGGTIMIVRDVTERDRLQRELQEVGQRLLHSNEELARLASTDDLTGLANRRHLLAVLERELRRARRYGHPVGLLLLDIDHFKNINDTLGHGAGDVVLRGVSETIQRALRDVDTVARIGGDELAVVLPETGTQGAWTTAQRIVDRVAAQSFPWPSVADLRVTVSVGLAVAEPGMHDVEELLHLADVALYEAKADGRNQAKLVAAPDGDEDGTELA